MSGKFPCPICQQNDLTTVGKYSFVRGFLIAHQITTRTAAGCPPCVAGEMRAEAMRDQLNRAA